MARLVKNSFLWRTGPWMTLSRVASHDNWHEMETLLTVTPHLGKEQNWLKFPGWKYKNWCSRNAAALGHILFSLCKTKMHIYWDDISYKAWKKTLANFTLNQQLMSQSCGRVSSLERMYLSLLSRIYQKWRQWPFGFLTRFRKKKKNMAGVTIIAGYFDFLYLLTS